MVGNLFTTPLESQYFATLLGHRWITRVTAWQPEGHRRIGRPKYRWNSVISWEMAAMDPDLW